MGMIFEARRPACGNSRAGYSERMMFRLLRDLRTEALIRARTRGGSDPGADFVRDLISRPATSA
jgi:hypothetical protein